MNGRYGHLFRRSRPATTTSSTRRSAGHPTPLFEWRKRYWSFLLKLDPDQPSPTIQAQPGPYVGPFHWKNRRLRLPEIKRLQTFPDDYEIVGSRRSGQMQVGNAVPPILAEQVAGLFSRASRSSGLSVSAPLELERLVSDIAEAFTAADGSMPAWVSRTGRAYRPGIGPHAEDAAVALMLSELRQTPTYVSVPCGQFLAYPVPSRQKCDLWAGRSDRLGH